MTAINTLNSAALNPATLQLRSGSADLPIALKQSGNLDASSAIPFHAKSPSKEEVKQHFTQFVGETFYGQMFKAMRSTVGKAAYFNGGRAEEMFQGQLDQTMSEQMTKRTASKFVEPMFERQFPNFADKKPAADFAQLAPLSRR